MTALAEDESPVYPGGFIYTQSSEWMYGTQEYVTSTIKFYIPDGYKVVLEYRIQVTLPDNVNQYTKGYYVEITDTMSKGLTYNENVKVLVDGVDATEKFTISSSVDTTSGKTTLTIKNENILKDNLATNNSVITVYYTCTLNKDAVLGSAGNPNDVDLIYDALLNIGGDGVMGYIEIPSIDVHLPIYHGTDDAVCRSPLAIWNGPACLSAARAPTVSFPATGACPPHGCSLTLTSLKRATISC